MRILRSMCGKTGKYRIRIECIWAHLGLALMGDKLKDLFETVRTCPMHFNNAGEEKIFYAG